VDAQRQPTIFTEREYLALEGVAETKHEFIDGHIVAMAGAEMVHNLICANLASGLTNARRGRPCLVLSSDQRVKVVATTRYFYPDVTVVCGTPSLVGPAPRSLTNPQAIFEVLSPSTYAYDTGEKLEAYRAIESLEDYVLIASERVHVTHYRRTGTHEWAVGFYTAGASLALTSGLVLEVDALYELVTFEA